MIFIIGLLLLTALNVTIIGSTTDHVVRILWLMWCAFSGYQWGKFCTKAGWL